MQTGQELCSTNSSSLEKNMKFVSAVYLSGLLNVNDWIDFLNHFDTKTIEQIGMAANILMQENQNGRN